MPTARSSVNPFTGAYYESTDWDLSPEWHQDYLSDSDEGEKNSLSKNSETPINYPFNDQSPDLAAEVATHYPDFDPIEIPLNYCPPPMSENRQPSGLAAQGASAMRPQRPSSLDEVNLSSHRAYLASSSRVMATRAHVQHTEAQLKALSAYLDEIRVELAEQEEAYAEASTAQALVLLSRPDTLATQQQNAQAFAEQQYYGGHQHTMAQQSALSAHMRGSRRSMHRQIARQTAYQHQARQRAQQQAARQTINQQQLAALQNAQNQELARQSAHQQQFPHQSAAHQQNGVAHQWNAGVHHQNGTAHHQNGAPMGNPLHQGQGQGQDQL